MGEQKRPTPEGIQMSLIEDALIKLISKGVLLILGMKAWIADILLECSLFHFVSAHWAERTSVFDRLSSNFSTAGTNGHLHFNLSLLAFCDRCN